MDIGGKNMNVFKLFEGLVSHFKPFYPVFNVVRDEVIRRGLEGQENGIPKTMFCADDTVTSILNKGALEAKFFTLCAQFELFVGLGKCVVNESNLKSVKYGNKCNYNGIKKMGSFTF
jgi:hypothetical protein